MRINQYVAAATGLSRRAADAVVRAGRVTVDGQPGSLGQTVSPGVNVCLDGQPLKPATTHTYLMLNKPVGYISSRRRQGADPTLYDLLPAPYHNLRLVGRLDRDSSGLMLLTDDGDFIQRHTHPSFHKLKVYDVTLAKPLSPANRQHLARGVHLIDGPSHLTVESATGPHVRVSLTEGRNRQIRRTFGTLGYTVETLHRVQMGEYRLGQLASGAWTDWTEISPDSATKRPRDPTS
jgi:23S rRNA pseudouridine2605 synthase